MNTCLCCGNDRFDLIYQNLLKKCTKCSFVTANMDVSHDVIKGIYTEEYFEGAEYSDYLSDKSFLQLNFNYRIRQIEKSGIKLDKNSKALEIGCAYGFFGELISKKTGSYTGVDIAEAAINWGKANLSLNLINADYLTTKPEEKFTDVFMWDVVEHLERPDLFIEKIHDETVSAAHIYITTGDIGSLVARIQKKKWRMIHPPSHLHYFNQRSITKMLKQRGFEVQSITYPVIYRSARQIYYSLFMLKKETGKLKETIYKTIPANQYIPFNSFDIMFVKAIKK